MEHSFNTDIAKRYGVHEAVFIHNLYFWILKNECNGRHYYEGRNWTYNSLTALEQLFPYFSRKQIRTVIANCEAKGAVIRGRFNLKGYDKTNWFALSEEVLNVYRGYAQTGTDGAQMGTENCAETGNCCAQTGTSCAQKGPTIPDSKPDNNNINNIAQDSQTGKFRKPTVEEVAAYCLERKNGIDARQFHSHYEAKGWRIGKTSMSSWKAAVRTWELNRKKDSGERRYKELE